MARPKTQESEPETVTVNITDFKRSRDAVSLLFLWVIASIPFAGSSLLFVWSAISRVGSATRYGNRRSPP